MPRSYLHALRPTLTQRLEAALEGSEAFQQLDVSDELALIRDAAGNAVKMYAEAVEQQLSTDALLAVGSLMTEQLTTVIRSAETAARVTETKQRVTTAFGDALARVISSILHAAYEVWGDDYKVGEFEKLIRERLKSNQLPGADGTLLTPDQDVQEMDSLVPKEGD